MARAKRIDANQTEIVQALRKAGASVQILSMVGEGCPDLLVGIAGRNLAIECKDGKKPPRARKLTPEQETWHRDWRGQVVVVETAEQALSAISPILPNHPDWEGRN